MIDPMVAALGPVQARLWQVLPYLTPVPDEVIAGAGEDRARALDARRGALGRRCALCNRRADPAVIASPRVGGFLTPVWADLCWPDYTTIRAEQDQRTMWAAI